MGLFHSDMDIVTICFVIRRERIYHEETNYNFIDHVSFYPCFADRMWKEESESVSYRQSGFVIRTGKDVWLYLYNGI